MANVDAADEVRFQSLEWWFYGGIGLLWLLGHLLLFCCGDTALFRSSWLSLAKMEVGKVGPFRVIGDTTFANGRWTARVEQLNVDAGR